MDDDEVDPRANISWWWQVEDAACNQNITDLNLSLKNIGVKKARLLSHLLDYTSVEHLILDNNDLGAESIQILSKVFVRMPIKILRLCDNKLGNAAMLELAGILPKTYITQLFLDSNCFNSDGMLTLAKVLECTHIERLSLSRNSIGIRGVRALCDVLPRTHIKILYLSGNIVCEEGVRALIEVLPYTDIVRLQVECSTDESSLLINKIVDTNAHNICARRRTLRSMCYATLHRSKQLKLLDDALPSHAVEYLRDDALERHDYETTFKRKCKCGAVHHYV